jgi:hypothetical protein
VLQLLTFSSSAVFTPLVSSSFFKASLMVVALAMVMFYAAELRQMLEAALGVAAAQARPTSAAMSDLTGMRHHSSGNEHEADSSVG